MLRRHGIMKVSIETDIATGTFVMAPGHRGRTGQLSSVDILVFTALHFNSFVLGIDCRPSVP